MLSSFYWLNLYERYIKNIQILFENFCVSLSRTIYKIIISLDTKCDRNYWGVWAVCKDMKWFSKFNGYFIRHGKNVYEYSPNCRLDYSLDYEIDYRPGFKL